MGLDAWDNDISLIVMKSIMLVSVNFTFFLVSIHPLIGKANGLDNLSTKLVKTSTTSAERAIPKLKSANCQIPD
ncbi:hypothetical protein AAMO2058_001635900 [Amorphochlora amoebiformis]